MPEIKSQFTPLPADTARTARTVYNIANLYLVIGDQIDQLLAGLNLVNLDPTSEVPVNLVTIYSMVTIFQFAEGLPDRQAADSTRTRMDWKYALHLTLNYPGLPVLSLCRFRQRLMIHSEGQHIFEQLIHRIAGLGLFSRRKHIDLSTQIVIQRVCDATRLDNIIQAFNQALECLAAQQPEWLRNIMLPHWYERYDGFNLRTPNIPTRQVERISLAQKLGSDANYLLKVARDLDDQGHNPMPEINNLARVFQDNFYLDHHKTDNKSEILWKAKTCATCNSFISDLI